MCADTPSVDCSTDFIEGAANGVGEGHIIAPGLKCSLIERHSSFRRLQLDEPNPTTREQHYKVCNAWADAEPFQLRARDLVAVFAVRRVEEEQDALTFEYVEILDRGSLQLFLGAVHVTTQAMTRPVRNMYMPG